MCRGSLGGGALGRAVLDDLQAMLERARDGATEVARRDFALAASLGMCCGGSVEVMMESFAAPWCVGIVGAGLVSGERSHHGGAIVVRYTRCMVWQDAVGMVLSALALACVAFCGFVHFRSWKDLPFTRRVVCCLITS